MKQPHPPFSDGRFSPEDWEYILLQMVNDRSGVDFGLYRMPTFRRRYLKRMNTADAVDLRSYVKLLEKDSGELDLLVTDLLIGVTSFFRDRAAFKVLNSSVVKPLFEDGDNSDIRCWVAGCSTGMEAYTIAMLMEEASVKNRGNYTIFATDISRTALATASRGVFSEKHFKTVPEEYRKYFTEVDTGWRISRDIRKHMVFSHHDVLADPPFSRMDIVSCRNMMIYLKNRAQELVLGRLNYSLRLGGFLFLGSGETPGARQDNLETVDSRWRVFRKTGETKITVDMFPGEKAAQDVMASLSSAGYSPGEDDEVSVRSRSFTSCLEERFFPDCVFIDEDYRILYINGDMNRYLSIPQGIPGDNLLPMLSPSLKTAVRAGARRARGSFRRIECDTRENTTVHISCVSPLEMSGVFLLEFVKTSPEEKGQVSRIHCSESDNSILEEQISLLESDLATTRRELRSRTGELQASNEELQTINEEIRSANEELTASNEELMASNEELQRLNRRLTELTDDMRNLIESMDVGSLFLDRELCIRRFNPTVSRFFKVTDSDIGRCITDFTTAIDRESFNSLITTAGQVVDSGVPRELPLGVDRTGDWIAKVAPYRTSAGTVEGTVLSFVEVTALRDRERSLAASERKFRGLFNGLPIGALLVFHETRNSEFVLLDRNPALEKIMRQCPDLLASDQFREGVLKETDSFDLLCSGRDLHCRSFRPVDFADTLCVTVRDVTETRRAGELKERLEKRLHDAQLLAGMGIWQYDARAEMVSLSPEAANLFGMPAEKPLHRNDFRELIDDFQSFYDDALELIRRGEVYTGSIVASSVDSSVKRFFRVSCYGAGGASSPVVIGYALDVSREVEAENTLQRANRKLAETQRMARIGVMEMQWDQGYMLHRERFNESALEVLKLDDPVQDGFFQRHLDETLEKNLYTKLRNCAMTGEGFSLDLPVRNGHGDNVFIQLTAKRKEEEGQPRTVSIVIMDVTRRHQLEKELKHSEKLRSVGELAGGIAHDFNNQLMGITGFAECLREICTSPEEEEYIKGILNSSERAGALVRQLLAFSRKGLSHIAPFDLHHLIDEVISLLKRSIDRRIEIRTDYRAGNSMVPGDASEMNNAILNLALNARDAMEGSGVMTFSTVETQPGRLLFSLTDTGRGMSPDVLERVFEPFFTTKPLGEGTGMGLAAVYGTVKAHNGVITMDSEPGKGTRVDVSLPVTEMQSASEDRPEEQVAEIMEGTVLVVDDEEVVRTVLSKLVSSLGFDVITASDGVQALEKYSGDPEGIRLVLMDMTMPRMNGLDAFLKMKEIDPEVKAIIISGHSAESTSAEILKFGVKRVLQKPVRLSALSGAIRKTV